MVLHQARAFQDVVPGVAELGQGDVRKARLQRLLNGDAGAEEIASQLGQCVQARSGQLHLLVLQQAAHQFGARVLHLFALGDLFRWQQHARLDLDQHGGHQQVFGCQFQVARAYLVDVDQVLARHAEHGNVEDVEVLLADQVEQQVQRAFKGVQKDFQRVGRDVEILRQGKQRFAVQARHGDVVYDLGCAEQHTLIPGQQRVGSVCVHGEYLLQI